MATTTHQVVITTMAEVIGVSILAIIADSSETLGPVMVALMVGWFLIWIMGSGSAFIGKLTGKL